MKILQFIGIGILVIIGIALIAALFIKKDYTIERSIVINKPKTVVFDYVKLLKNQDNFSVWAKIDPQMRKEYKGTDGMVGFVAAWDSDNKNAGKGEQTITGITEGSAVNYSIHFIKPFEGLATAQITTDSIGLYQTNVKWYFASSMKYPMNLMLVCMDIKKMIGNDLLGGLNNLKNLLEKQ